VRRRLSVLVLARSFPNPLLPTLGLWTLRPMSEVAEACEVRVVSPVPYCPPLPQLGPLSQYTRFRSIPRSGAIGGLDVLYPRFVVGPGNSTYALESESYYLAIRRAVGRLWAEKPFDLIHANFIYPDGAVAHRLSRQYGVPFVVTELAPWTGWIDRGVRQKALPAARAAASILALSNSVRATIHDYEPLAKVRVVPPGVDGDEFTLVHPESRKPDQILFVGFVNFNKGVDVLLRAIAFLRDQGLPGHLILVGGAHYRNTRRQEEDLHALAATLRLDGRVEFVGKQAPAEVARLMAESSVLVLPSRAEAFGAVLTEALACGTPVVATRCGGPEDIVTEEVGALVPLDDPEALARAVGSVLSERTRYPPSALRAYALDRFGISTVAGLIHRANDDAVETPVSPPEARHRETA
jgi:teichuronic acid biosynthesis glycosyltransferase TuaC